MSLLDVFVLVIFCFGFMYFIQITTWTLPSFRQGIIVHKYREPFSGKIPKELMNREIALNNIIFKFISQNTGLFKAHPPLSFFKNTAKSYFPSILGEIDLNHKGVAQITLRIPLSTILIYVALCIALVISNIEGTFTINSFIPGVLKGGFLTIIFSIFFAFGFFREKEHLHEGVMMLKESVNDGTLV